MDFSRMDIEWSHVIAAWGVAFGLLTLAVWAVRRGWVQ